MSFEEKSIWIYGVLSAVVSAAYFAIVLGRARTTAVTEIAYEWLMLTAIAVAMGLSIIAHMAVAIGSPKEADKKDARDTDIHRHGEYFGGYALVLGVLAALGLTMARLDHFWIANAIYLAFALQAITASAVKIIAYRRGF